MSKQAMIAKKGGSVLKRILFYRVIATFILFSTVFAAAAPDAGMALAQQSNDKEAKPNYSLLGFSLMKETIDDLLLGIDDREVLKKLGEPENKSAAQIWGADGMEHQRWFYPAKGIELSMIRKGSQQVVDRISLTSPCDYKTQRGIQIGSKVAEVQLAYQPEINPQSGQTDSRIVAGTIYGGIIFGVKQGEVTSIFIGAAAE